MKSKKGKVVAITSSKGGVGKSILTLNLAGIYALKNYKVLIIDMDLYSGVIALSVNKEPLKTIYNMVDDLSNNRYKDFYDYVTKYNDNIDILASPKDPRQANKISNKYIDMVLANAAFKYDIVLIDSTHVLDEINLIAMDNADTIGYVFTNDPFDLKNAKSFMAIMHDTEQDNVRVILNLSSRENRNYFSPFDIKNIIEANIDYTISNGLFIRDIDRYILEGTILSLNKNLNLKSRSEFKKLEKMAFDFIGNKNEESKKKEG